MFTPTFDPEWLRKKLDEEDDAFINAGGERTEQSSGIVTDSSFAESDEKRLPQPQPFVNTPLSMK